MTIKLSNRSVFLQADNLGDGTTYKIALANWQDAVYSVAGGNHDPVGGIMPKIMLKEFNAKVVHWAKGRRLGHPDHFVDILLEWRSFIHYSDKQRESYYNKWDLATAIIFAWLFMLGHEQDEEATPLLGYLYNNNRREALFILEEVLKIMY